MQMYGAYGEKMHYGKLITGTTRTTTIIGPDGNVANHWKKVPNAEAHPGKVLEFLKEQAK
jgi:peroxiredoxin Q/BCP